MFNYLLFEPKYMLGLISISNTTPVTLILSRLADYALIAFLNHSTEIAKVCKRMYETAVKNNIMKWNIITYTEIRLKKPID